MNSWNLECPRNTRRATVAGLLGAARMRSTTAHPVLERAITLADKSHAMDILSHTCSISTP